MKGIRFYEELRNKGRKNETSRGTVFAAFIVKDGPWHGRNREPFYEGIGSVSDHKGFGVCGSQASLDYLRGDCRRISEARAREVHPELFSILDTMEG